MQLQEQRQLLIFFRVVRVFNLLQQQLFHMSLNTQEVNLV
jgi:hypothetical protein